MEKIKRSERVPVMMKMFMDAPNKLFTLGYFGNMFLAAKTTISEDVVIIRELCEKYHLGMVVAVSGASGGVKYIPYVNGDMALKDVQDICDEIICGTRKLDGGFVFINDIISNPLWVKKMTNILVSQFYKTEPDFIVTMESKGIPLAYSVAQAFSKQLIVINREKKATDGTSITIHYFPNDSLHGRQMVVSKRMIKPGQRALVIDDFMRGGGTLKGICEMMKEFSAIVVGIGVAVSTKQPSRKMIGEYKSLMTLDSSKYDEKISLTPSGWVKYL